MAEQWGAQGYYRRVMARAAGDTWRMATGQGLVVTGVCAVLGLAAFWVYEGTDDARKQVLTWALFGVLPVGVVTAAAFIWNFVLTPARLERKQAFDL